jgi:Tfp pilus assembly protein PilF
MLMDHQRWDEAIRWYREALAISPGQPDVVTDLGACLVDSGRPAEGLAEFEKVLKQDPSHRNALYNKGVALMHLGKEREAAAVFEDLMKRHPDDPQMKTLRAQVETLKASSGAGR